MCLYLYMYKYMYIWVYICMYNTYIRVHMYIYIYIKDTRHTSINYITHRWVMYHIHEHTSFERYFLRHINGTICATWSSGIFSNMRVLFKNLSLNHTISELYHLIWLVCYFTYLCVRGTSTETHFTSHLTSQNMLFLLTLTYPYTLFGLLLTLTLLTLDFTTEHFTLHITSQHRAVVRDGTCVFISYICVCRSLITHTNEACHTYAKVTPHLWMSHDTRIE